MYCKEPAIAITFVLSIFRLRYCTYESLVEIHHSVRLVAVRGSPLENPSGTRQPGSRQGLAGIRVAEHQPKNDR